MTILQTIGDAFSSRLQIEKAGSGELVTVPLALHNGNLIQVYVEELGGGRWLVSDQRQAVTELALAGVNVDDHKSAAVSWGRLRRDLPLETPLMLESVTDYDLAGVSSADELGQSVLAVAETVLRADALVALAPGYKSRKFRDVIVQAAGRHELGFKVEAQMPARHGGSRSVSLSLHSGSDVVYVQTISNKRSVLDGFDKAQAVFTSANVGDGQLAAIVASGISLSRWQLATLEEHGVTVPEIELDTFMARVAGQA